MPHGPLPARRIRFEYPPDFDPAWNPRLPDFACAANSVSLLMPSAEPYFVKSVRSAFPLLDDSTWPSPPGPKRLRSPWPTRLTQEGDDLRQRAVEQLVDNHRQLSVRVPCGVVN